MKMIFNVRSVSLGVMKLLYTILVLPTLMYDEETRDIKMVNRQNEFFFVK